MILDNADDPNIFRDAKDINNSSQLQVDLASYIPDCEHGSILITTRDLIVGRRLANGRPPLQINKMSREEALLLLKTRLSTRGEISPITPATPASYQQPVSDTDLLRLAQSLDYLPLAMVQATGFITENAISISQYMRLFEDDASAVQLLKHNIEESGRDIDIPTSVYATWKISIEQIQKAYPKSAGLIFLMAHYEQSQIPRTLLQIHVGENVIEFTTIIGVLLRFSLIVSGRDATYNMHRLVQLIVKQWLAASGVAAEWQSKALRLLSSQFPSGEFETWAACASLESHAVKTINSANIKDEDRSYLGTLQIRLAWYYSNRGNWSIAEEYARAACITLQGVYGIRHRETLAAKTKFAHILKQNSKLEEAEVIIKETVDESKALLGSKDQLYFDALDLFALIAQTRGRLSAAEKASRKVLSGRQKVLGQYHPSVFRSQRRLATILEFSGRYDEAEACIMSALNGQKHLIGTADKTTLQVMQRLVFIQRAQGKYSEAEKTASDYLKVSTATYGPNHIDTQEARYTFAFSLISSGKIEEAETIFLSLIDFIEKEHPFGPDHQYNFYMLNALSSIRVIQGRYKEASELQLTAWNGIQKTYGKHHAKTNEYQSAYAAALALADAADLDRAMILQQEAYNALKLAVGSEHPSTLKALLRLSDANVAKGEMSSALKMAEQALRGREKVLSADHPEILAARKRVTELRTMSLGTVASNTNFDKATDVSAEKKQMKKRSFFGLRSQALSDVIHTRMRSLADSASTNQRDTHVVADELEKSRSHDSDEKTGDKEIELLIESDSDNDEIGESLDIEKSASFTYNPLMVPPPAVVASSNATIQDNKATGPNYGTKSTTPSQKVEQDDNSEPPLLPIRRKPVASRPLSYVGQGKHETKPDAGVVVPETVINPAARLDGPGWDASPFGT